MIAIILASGRGTRLQPMTDDRPKPLVEIDSKPLLEFQLDALQENGVTTCLITTGPFEDQIRKLTSKYPEIEFLFAHNERYAETDYIYSLWLAGKLIEKEGYSDDVLLFHGDLVFKSSIIEQVLRASADDVVVVEKDGELILKDFCARIIDGTVEKINTHIEGDNIRQLYPIYRFSHQTFYTWMGTMEQIIEEGGEEEYAEAALNQLLETVELKPIWINQFCAEVDTPSDLEAVEQWWRSENPS